MQRRLFLQLALPAASTLVTPTLGAASSVRLVVVVGNDSPLKNIELTALRRLFGGDPVADPSGRGLIPFNHPPLTPDRVGFDRLVLGMSADQVAKYWIDRKIRAQSGPPRTVTSLRMLLGVVSKLPGAIGYVRAQYLSAEVRRVTVSGKDPDSADYPLVFNE